MLPAAQGVRRAERAPRGRRRAHLRQPAQHGGGLDPPAGHQAHRPAAAVHVELLDRRAGGHRVREPLRVADVAQGARLQGQRRHPAPHRPGRRGQGLQGLGGAARVAGLRDRRRGGQGGRPGPAAAAGRGRARAARGDRLEVPAHDGHHHARARDVERRPHRAHGAVRAADAGAGQRRDREAGHAAQRGGHRAQGRTRGRRGDRDPCRRRDPARGLADGQGAEAQEPLAAAPGARGCPACDTPTVRPDGTASGPSAPTARAARASCSRRSSSSSPAAPWTSRGWARSGRCSSSRTA